MKRITGQGVAVPPSSWQGASGPPSSWQGRGLGSTRCGKSFSGKGIKKRGEGSNNIAHNPCGLELIP